MRTGLLAICILAIVAVANAQATTCQPGYCYKVLDCFFVLDGSGSIDNTEWNQLKAFVVNVLNRFQIGPNQAKFGIIQFSGGNSAGIVELEQGITDNAAQLQSTMTGLVKLGGWTAIGDGMQRAHQELNAYGRANVEWMMIVITDGYSNRGSDPAVTSNAAKQNVPEITIFQVAVGSGVDEVGMRSWCTQPSSDHYVFATNFASLDAVIQSLVDDTCQGCSADCNGNGNCICGTCDCTNGWTGQLCDIAPMTCQDDNGFSTPEDTAVIIDPKINDDASNFAFSITSVGNPASGTGTTAYISATDKIQYTPATNWNGNAIFNYCVTNVEGTSDCCNVRVSVTPVGDSPSCQHDACITTEDNAVTCNILNNDAFPDADGSFVSGPNVVAPLATGGVATTTGTYLSTQIRYTPNANFNGVDQVIYRIVDNKDTGPDETISCQLTVTVTAVPDAPIANPDSATTGEDVAVKIEVLANDVDVDGFGIKVDDTYTITVAPAGAGTVSYYSQPTADRERFVLFTPAANFNGQATFLYQITDLRTPIASRLTDTALVTVTVTPEQDAPIANDDTYTHAEDSTVRNHNVVANDIDNDNSPPSNVGLCISAVTTAPNKGGTATITGACPTTVQYTPAPNFNGEEIYYYTVEDPQGNVSNAGKVTVTITPSNDDPVAVDDTAATTENAGVLIGVLANDYHPDAVNGITFTIDPNFPDPSAGGAVTDLKPDNGMATVQDGAIQAVLYVPDAGFFGVDTFTYTIVDTRGASSTAVVRVTVLEDKVGPTAVDDTFETVRNVELKYLNVMANDLNPEADVITLVSVGQTKQAGAVSEVVASNNTVNYVPPNNFIGSDDFDYTITDLGDNPSTATVTINVKPEGDALLFDPDDVGGVSAGAVVGIVAAAAIVIGVIAAVVTRWYSRRQYQAMLDAFTSGGAVNDNALYKEHTSKESPLYGQDGDTPGESRF